METIREHNVEAISVMHWEGLDFEFIEQEINFVRATHPIDRGNRKPHLTAKQKRLMEAERYTNSLP